MKQARGKWEPVFFIVTQSQNNSPKVVCSACHKAHYWGKGKPDPRRKGVYVVQCSICRLARLNAKRVR